MKKTFINIMFTSNVVIVFIAVYALINGAEFMYLRTIFEVLGANAIIHLGLFFTKKLESKYVILEYLLDIGSIILVLGVFGIIFRWHSSVPIWVIFIIAVIVYLLSILLNIVRNHQKAKRINELLQKRKNTGSNIVT